jgi:hypothetical protein
MRYSLQNDDDVSSERLDWLPLPEHFGEFEQVVVFFHLLLVRLVNVDCPLPLRDLEPVLRPTGVDHENFHFHSPPK